MEISYKGGTSLIITTKKNSLFVDPKVSYLGLKDPTVNDGVELATEARYILPGARLLIESPGEYEVGDFSIHGIAAKQALAAPDAFATATIFRIETSDVRIGIIGHIQAKLSDEQLEELGVLDILIIAVGGNGFSLDPHDAATLARLIDPKVVVPVHYEDEKLAYEVPQLPVSEFIKELAAPVETVDKYKLKAASVLPENLTLVQIARS